MDKPVVDLDIRRFFLVRIQDFLNVIIHTKLKIMEKSQKVGAQIYGYAVCLTAVITFLISVSTLVNAILDLGDPLHAGWTPPEAPSLASFENYKMDILRSIPKGEGAGQASYIPDDATLKGMFEAAKNDKIQSSRHNSMRNVMIGGILMVICTILFITHWRWMKKITRT